MRRVSDFPFRVREIEHAWIPMRDGARLAARLWIPESEALVPALLEYIPYGKRIDTRERDEPMHGWFAGHGYACARVDLRGSGDSEGVLRDEYLEQELSDGCEVIAWLAAQPWCSGAVGMIGKSWGAFNALQIAAKQPPALRAVIAVCGTDDRYADDAHYMGGCLIHENFGWGMALFSVMTAPPDPALVGERWRALWRERLEAARPPVIEWLRHPERDAYWKHGSVCENYGAVRVPVYAISGWADAYSNAVPRLVANLYGVAKGLIGPWGHLYPHEGVPGPAIGFLHEAKRWWDEWLRGIDTGVRTEPALRVWMQEHVPPQRHHAQRPGRWVAEERWPSPRIATRELALAKPGLREGAGEELAATFRSPTSAGLAAGPWCSFGGEHPPDQREDDDRSLCFDSEPLAARTEILGAPRVRLSLASDRAHAQLAVRLCDVAPDGSSLRVTYGLLNLTHRSGHARAEPLVPGERFEVELALCDVAHAFPAGHRVRLALSTSYWPLAWPAPEPATLTLLGGALSLPVRPPRAEDAALAPFAEPEAASGPEIVWLREGGFQRKLEREPGSGELVRSFAMGANADGEHGVWHLPAIDLASSYAVRGEFRTHDDDPLATRSSSHHVATLARGEWSARVETELRVSGTLAEWRVEAALHAFEGDRQLFAHAWDERVPRQGT